MIGKAAWILSHFHQVEGSVKNMSDQSVYLFPGRKIEVEVVIISLGALQKIRVLFK